MQLLIGMTQFNMDGHPNWSNDKISITYKKSINKHPQNSQPIKIIIKELACGLHNKVKTSEDRCHFTNGECIILLYFSFK